MVKCESGTNGYTEYVHFTHPLYTWDGCKIGKFMYFLLRGRWTIISCDLVLFNFKLLAVAQSDMCWISCGMTY